jgi:hypothetical protein
MAAALRKIYSDDYRFAGVATRDEEPKFRASSNDYYAEKLRNEGDTDVRIVELPRAMTKPEAALYLMRHPDYQAPQDQEVLRLAARGANIDQDSDRAPIQSPSSNLITLMADLAERETGSRPTSITMTWSVPKQS